MQEVIKGYYPEKKRKVGGEPEGSDDSIDTAIPATSAAAMAASGGLSAEKDNLISISTSLNSQRGFRTTLSDGGGLI